MTQSIQTYYTLRYQHNDGLHRTGERIAASNDLLRIGQQEDCEVMFDNASDFADELFAVVRPADSGWILIPCSEFVKTFVNGTEVFLLHVLHDGDKISFSESSQELLFDIHQDNLFDSAKGIQRLAAPIPRKLIAALIALPVCLFVLLGWWINKNNNREQDQINLIYSVKSSVMQLCVDSVFYCRIIDGNVEISDRYSYISDEGHSINGTAFCVEGNLLVTARHCIEPWLNNPDILNKPLDSISSLPVIWALEAETYNQTHGSDTIYKVVSLCELIGDQDGKSVADIKILSSDFNYNTDTDDIIDLSDFYTERYWRSIARHNARTDMMLNDIAVFNSVSEHASWVGSTENNIVMAKNVEDYLKEGTRLYFMGYPNFDEKGFEMRDGRVLQTYQPGKLISHDGNLSHGHSGGPVLIIEDDVVYAVGVISVTDKSGGNRMYSVPITAMKKGDAQ